MRPLMRHLIALIIAAPLILPFPLAVAADPGANASRREVASAVWLKKSAKGYSIFIVDVRRVLDVKRGTAETRVRVDKAGCKKRPGIILCTGDGGEINKEVAPQAFLTDPVLEQASLSFEHKRRTFSAAWTATDEEPAHAVQPGIGGSEVSALFALHRRARATGNLFGQELGKSGLGTYMFVTNYARARPAGPIPNAVRLNGHRLQLVMRR